MEKIISIIVPVFNAENTLTRCINSILLQSYRNFELILIDDGSIDGSWKIMESAAKKDNRVKCIHKENKGVSDARNLGLNMAKGEFICFVDADDWLSSDYLEKMLFAMISNGADIVTCGHYRVTSSSSKAVYMSDPVEYSSEDALIELLTMGKIGNAVWDKLFKSDLIKDNPFPYGEVVNEELFVLVHSFSKAKKIVNCGEVLYYYYQNAASVSQTYTIEKAKIVNRNLFKVCEWANDKGDLIKKAAMQYKAYFENAILINLTRYSLSNVDNKFTKELKNNYKRDIKYILNNKNLSNKEKIKALLNWIGVYSVIYRVFRNT